MIFEQLEYFFDKHAHTGQENMAIDDQMLQSIGALPRLRVYAWSKPTVTYGYFLQKKDAQAAFPAGNDGLEYVRRPTGGGIVDHRGDLTYTLAIPASHAIGKLRGLESYRIIHQSLVETLQALGVDCRLTVVESGEGLSCFSHPVAYDILNACDQKLAGAGQRRNRQGILHQGSLQCALDPLFFGETFGTFLSDTVIAWSP